MVTTHTHTPNVTQEKTSHPANSHTYMQIFRLFGLVLVVLVSLILFQFGSTTGSAGKAKPDVNVRTFYELTLNGDGDAAVQQLAALADARGGWKPAPGDDVAYDPDLRLSVRASVRIVDLPPEDCADPEMRLAKRSQCTEDFTQQQNIVRFGYTTFVEVLNDGSPVPRLAVDDLLSVYIEEVGHSWQEYLYETEGRGVGERTRLTSSFARRRWADGWEYQAKMYILSLNGTWLTLSGAERDEVKQGICAKDISAQPIGNAVPEYGPPPGWPNPQGWPTTDPTVEEFQRFCN